MKFSNEKTWYEDITQATHSSFPTLKENVACDVCIVGGGLSAVVAALNLAESGQSVVVLEASDISYGSTGRAGVPLFGGFFHTEYKDLKKKLGIQKARLVWEQTLRARNDIDERMKRHNISCGYVPGIYFAGSGGRHKSVLEERHISFEQDFRKSDPVEFLNAQKFKERVKCEGFTHALYHKLGGSMNLVKFLYELVKVAEQQGVRFFEKTHVTSFEFGKPNVVKTSQGEVVAQKVIVCGSAYMPEFSAPDETSSISTSYFQWVSKPLSPNVAAEISAGRETIFDMQFLPQYYQVTLDNRIIIGGPDHYLEKDPVVVASRICARAKKIFPKGHSLKTEYLWRGRIGTSMYSPPAFEKMENDVFLIHGMSGHGAVVAYMCGLILADAAQGDTEELDLFISSQLPKKTKWIYMFSTWIKLMQHRGQSLVRNVLRT